MNDRPSFYNRLCNVYVRAFTRKKGELVGTDAMGNEYYREVNPPSNRRERRWVLYAPTPEASLVPPEWHGWLHHNQPTPIAEDSPFRQSWIKPHQPNMSGTIHAYRPDGHTFGKRQRPQATGDYEAWTP